MVKTAGVRKEAAQLLRKLKKRKHKLTVSYSTIRYLQNNN